MAKQGQPLPDTGKLDSLAGAARQAAGRGLPPVHLWDPPFCGDIDMRIAADGTWYYLGTPIGRPALVRLFSTILRRDGDAYVLVTPVEKVGIRVDDAPFTAVEMTVEGEGKSRRLGFRTNVDDWVACDAAHALRFEPGAEEGLVPYLHVRSGLWAKLTRPLYYDLVELGEESAVADGEAFGVWSGGTFFAMADAAQVRDAR